MIARISGRLEKVAAGAALIDMGGGLWYEVLIPTCDADHLGRRVGQDVVLHTIHYLDGDPSRGAQTPRLLGFELEKDRQFFRIFTTVKGIGMRKALRAMARPAGEVAAAIAAKDSRYLATLPEIGKRTAEQIIAELHDKVDEYAGRPAPGGGELSETALEALSVLVQLGERRSDATALVQRVLAGSPEIQSPEQIIQQSYKLKAEGL